MTFIDSSNQKDMRGSIRKTERLCCANKTVCACEETRVGLERELYGWFTNLPVCRKEIMNVNFQRLVMLFFQRR